MQKPNNNNNNNNNDIDISIDTKKRLSKRQRRVKTKYLLSVFNVGVICLIFVSGFVYLLFFPREKVSNEENRELTEFPEFSASDYLSGKYTAQIADWYDDTVHGRTKIKQFLASKILPLKGREYGNDGLMLYSKDGNINIDENKDKPVSPPTEAPTEAPTEPVTNTDETVQTTAATSTTAVTVTTTAATTLPDNKNPAEDGEIANNIVVVKNRGLMLYGGGKENGQEYAASLNAYKSSLGDGVNVYSMVCPTAVSYYMPENYLDMTASEKDNIDAINASLSGVTPIDVYDALLLHKSEAIYSRTDHHWQPLGAYYAAEEFARTANVPFAPMSEYEIVTLPGYVGTLYGYTKNASLLNNPEDFIYYKPKAATVTTRYTTAFTEPHEDVLTLDPTPMSNSNYYMVFGGDEQITHVATSCKNGRTLVIFKDSYGNALLPVLTNSFENIYLCDIRYFDLNAVSFVQQVGATDLLFAMNTFSATGGNHDYIEINRTK